MTPGWQELSCAIRRRFVRLQPARRGTRRPCLEDLQSRLVPATTLSSTACAGIGPAALANGQVPCAGLSGQVSRRVTGVATDPKDANTIYIPSAGGGVWKTTDGGAHWSQRTDTLSTPRSFRVLSVPPVCVPRPGPVAPGEMGQPHHRRDCRWDADIRPSQF
jgi:hypothetical protein